MNLPHDKLKEFRAWDEKIDADSWDQQIKNDVHAGKLDSLANSAIAEHKAKNKPNPTSSVKLISHF